MSRSVSHRHTFRMTKKEPIKSQLRIPADLRALLLEATAKSGRSMNAEIVARLRRSFLGADYFGLDPDMDEALINSAFGLTDVKSPSAPTTLAADEFRRETTKIASALAEQREIMESIARRLTAQAARAAKGKQKR
jgi:hypothetical protein